MAVVGDGGYPDAALEAGIEVRIQKGKKDASQEFEARTADSSKEENKSTRHYKEKMQEQVQRPGEEATVEDESILTQFAEKHRLEAFSIIDTLPSAVRDQRVVEKRLERLSCFSDALSVRFRHLLDLYQEQPTLLDSALETMMNKLLAHIKWPDVGQLRFDELSNLAFSLLAHVAKVRGYKAFLSLLPHEVSFRLQGKLFGWFLSVTFLSVVLFDSPRFVLNKNSNLALSSFCDRFGSFHFFFHTLSTDFFFLNTKFC
ncbi:unnamed protein product [Gongylonema pulchrum]|uniref:DDE Tnp4 domain-containing protein n=1 Tax=Gongylonema pulchrum TaxID=637853 RepID=A0A183DYR8_9BILA|nr:unnamed protein product [Gongylonema pulchrum]